MAVPSPDSEADRVLIVVAHPDDAYFGAASTTTTWTLAGIEVTCLLCTYGDQCGIDGGSMNPTRDLQRDVVRGARAEYSLRVHPSAFPELLADEGLAPWTVDELWLMADERADHVIDITDTFDAKLAALRAHVSQTGHLGDGLETRMRSWGGGIAGQAGLGPGRPAEVFRVVATG